MSNRSKANWRGGRGGGGGGGGGGGSSNNSTSSCRNHGIVVATCESAREREASKELVNVLNQVIDDMESAGALQSEAPQEKSVEREGGGTEEASMSIVEMLAAELNQVREKKHRGTQNIMSINTGIKGLVIAKVMRSDVCPVALVKSLFDKVKRDKEALTRYCARIIPLKRVFYPNDKELRLNIRETVSSLFPGIRLPDVPEELEQEPSSSSSSSSNGAREQTKSLSDTEIMQVDSASSSSSSSSEDVGKKRALASTTEAGQDEEVAATSSEEEVVKKLKTEHAPESAATTTTKSAVAKVEVEKESVPYPPIVYQLLMKTRNHTVMTKSSAFALVAANLPPTSRQTSKDPKHIIVLEAIKNICGLTMLTTEEVAELNDFNLRKFTESVTGIKFEGKSKPDYEN